MAISRCELGSRISPQLTAAIITAIAAAMESERPKLQPYVPRKSQSWKTLCLQEHSWGLGLRR